MPESGRRLLVLATIKAIDRNVAGASAVDPRMAVRLSNTPDRFPVASAVATQTGSPARPRALQTRTHTQDHRANDYAP
jgi:hypothetical protein